MMRRLSVAIAIAFLTACSDVKVVRTSENTMTIVASVERACGAIGAANVAQKTAAIETILAGYDGFLVARNAAWDTEAVGLDAQHKCTDDCTSPDRLALGGYYHRLEIVLLKGLDMNREAAVDARNLLGPDWQEIVRHRRVTCD